MAKDYRNEIETMRTRGKILTMGGGILAAAALTDIIQRRFTGVTFTEYLTNTESNTLAHLPDIIAWLGGIVACFFGHMNTGDANQLERLVDSPIHTLWEARETHYEQIGALTDTASLCPVSELVDTFQHHLKASDKTFFPLYLACQDLKKAKMLDYLCHALDIPSTAVYETELNTPNLVPYLLERAPQIASCDSERVLVVAAGFERQIREGVAEMRTHDIYRYSPELTEFTASYNQALQHAEMAQAYADIHKKVVVVTHMGLSLSMPLYACASRSVIENTLPLISLD